MKKIFKKLKLRDLIFFIVGAVIFGSTGVLATTYVLQSSEIQYTNNKSVQQAIDELFVKAENCGKGSSETLPIGDVTVSGTQISIPYTGSYDKITCVYGTDENYGSTGTISNNVCTFSGSSNTKYYYKLIATKISNNTGTVYENSGNKTTLSGPTKVLTGLPTGVKAIVYLDPTNISKSCNASNSTVGGNTKSGCMKWYAYKEDSSSYTMILDHNTTAKVNSWSAASTQLTTDTSGWAGSPRLITGQEIADITGNTSWTYTGSGFYFNGNFSGTQTIGSNIYHWLFNYTNGCTSYGCKVADSSTNGYWTSTWYSSSRAWYVHRYGLLDGTSVSNTDIGVRPVITISKSNF